MITERLHRKRLAFGLTVALAVGNIAACSSKDKAEQCVPGYKIVGSMVLSTTESANLKRGIAPENVDPIRPPRSALPPRLLRYMMDDGDFKAGPASEADKQGLQKSADAIRLQLGMGPAGFSDLSAPVVPEGVIRLELEGMGLDDPRIAEVPPGQIGIQTGNPVEICGKGDVRPVMPPSEMPSGK